ETVGRYHAWAKEQTRIARERQQLTAVKAMLESNAPAPKTVAPAKAALNVVAPAQAGQGIVAPAKAGTQVRPDVATTKLDPGLRREDNLTDRLDALIADRESKLDPRAQKLLAMWP